MRSRRDRHADDSAVGPQRHPQEHRDAYDSERNRLARERGLATPYIPGGTDPDQSRAESEDRRYLRILLAMVVVIVLAGFVLGIVAALLGLTSLVGNPG